MRSITLQPVRLIAGAFLTTLACAVLADPPPHAPAHGWRAEVFAMDLIDSAP